MPDEDVVKPEKRRGPHVPDGVLIDMPPREFGRVLNRFISGKDLQIEERKGFEDLLGKRRFEYIEAGIKEGGPKDRYATSIIGSKVSARFDNIVEPDKDVRSKEIEESLSNHKWLYEIAKKYDDPKNINFGHEHQQIANVEKGVSAVGIGMSVAGAAALTVTPAAPLVVGIGIAYGTMAVTKKATEDSVVNRDEAMERRFVCLLKKTRAMTAVAEELKEFGIEEKGLGDRLKKADDKCYNTTVLIAAARADSEALGLDDVSIDKDSAKSALDELKKGTFLEKEDDGKENPEQRKASRVDARHGDSLSAKEQSEDSMKLTAVVSAYAASVTTKSIMATLKAVLKPLKKAKEATEEIGEGVTRGIDGLSAALAIAAHATSYSGAKDRKKQFSNELGEQAVEVTEIEDVLKGKIQKLHDSGTPEDQNKAKELFGKLTGFEAYVSDGTLYESERGYGGKDGVITRARGNKCNRTIARESGEDWAYHNRETVRDTIKKWNDRGLENRRDLQEVMEPSMEEPVQEQENKEVSSPPDRPGFNKGQSPLAAISKKKGGAEELKGVGAKVGGACTPPVSRSQSIEARQTQIGS